MRKIRDPELVERLHARGSQELSTRAWRITRAGRDPVLATAPKGRWDDGSFLVLYAALDANAARAELHWHLTRGQPVFPSQLRLHLHELDISARKAILLPHVTDLEVLGVDTRLFGTLEYARLQQEYTVTQQIGEAAHFLGADALVVPSARWPGQNLVIFPGNLDEGCLIHVKDHGPQDLRQWAANHANV